MVLSSIDEIIALLPIDILRIDNMGFPAIDGIMLKTIIKSTIIGAIETVAEPVRPVYEAARITYGMARLVGSEKSTMDQALAPLNIAKSLPKIIAKSIKDNLDSVATDTMTVPKPVLDEAKKLLDKINIPYQAVAAAAAFGGGPAMRLVHPLLYEDDIPPYERLNLENILFVLFLVVHQHFTFPYCIFLYLMGKLSDKRSCHYGISCKLH